MSIPTDLATSRAERSDLDDFRSPKSSRSRDTDPEDGSSQPVTSRSPTKEGKPDEGRTLEEKLNAGVKKGAKLTRVGGLTRHGL